MNIIAFGASSSTTSINQQLAHYTAKRLAEQTTNANIELLDLNDYQLPMFSEQVEAELGQPAPAKAFLDKLLSADVIIISFAEHNGNYTAAYKNLFDWVSRIEREMFKNAALLLMATSPGPGGASSVLSIATNSAPYFAGDVKASVSIPSFYDNFDMEKQQLTDAKLIDQVDTAISKLV